ncbi:chlorite dismutase [Sulfurisphaera ohwakuensis]|uniref:Chlorite dismutase n=2 Tax=Sulfurisphaera ohwakuensis TaxID=69656 RepID=A0A7J9RRN7_SULOH|nr:chlorite dismutase [Sulfurisphaera ohwakuensis]
MNKLSNYVYMTVSMFKFSKEWWKSGREERKQILSRLNEVEKEFSNKLVSLKRFISLRYDGDIIYWTCDYNTTPLNDFRYSLLSVSNSYLEEKVSFFSVFKPSPYTMGGNKDLSSFLKIPPLKYFVAYPMKKSPEWYLLPFEERRDIMAEHINIAKNHPDNEGIRSYTTYSFGIGDYEFVVIYEIPDLYKWTNVVEKLREAKARKWITLEEPILVGELGDLDIFVK